MMNALTNTLLGVLRIILLFIVCRTLLNFVLRGRLDKGKHQRMANPKGHYDYKIYKMKLSQIRYARYKKMAKKVVKNLVICIRFFRLKTEEFRRRVNKKDVSTIWTDFTAMQEESMIGTEYVEKPTKVKPHVSAGVRVSHDLL